MNKNKIVLVVFDLAGTVVDHGSRAPAGAFCELFRRRGIVATEAEARVPMGMHKRDHIAEMLGMPAIADQWRRKHGRDSTVQDLDSLFQEFLPLQLDALPQFADAIPGAADAVARLKTKGVKTAATTGYNREMTSFLVEALASQGMVFDFTCCAAEVPAGRPRPWMIQRCMEALDAFPPRRVVNIGDTIADIRSGVNAGVWSIGATMTGNMLGMSREQAEGLTAEEAGFLHETARQSMHDAGADMVVESVASLPHVIERIEHELAKDMHPGAQNARRVEPALNRLLEKPRAVAAGVSLR